MTIPAVVLWFIRGLVVGLIPATYYVHQYYATKQRRPKSFSDAPDFMQDSQEWKAERASAERYERRAEILRNVLAFFLSLLILLSIWLG